MLFLTYTDDTGNTLELEGESVEEIAQQLNEDEEILGIVYDRPGFVRGFIRNRHDWRAS